MARLDPHSYCDDGQPKVSRLRWDVAVDFDRHFLAGQAALEFGGEVSGPLDLDTRDLQIRSVTAEGRTVAHEWGEADPILGKRLRLDLPPRTREVMLDYETSPEASALQWLSPVQTRGKKHPFLFSQCQAIHARSIVPLQDTPRARIAYSAKVTVPEALTAVMSAGSAGSRPGPAPGTRTFLFEMPQPIPPYLLALCVGDLASRDVSGRTRVWAEPETVEAAAWEFGCTEEMIKTAEGLFGPYDWERFDILVLPPSFPYGGMENPRLTFLTPTLLAGDRSLVAVVVHELAHSWTGNLVTNANADHFWLNEGFTVWAERRILEALKGPDVAARSWAIGNAGLEATFKRFGKDSPLTRLRMDLKGVHPDDSFSDIPYEKGARFVTLLERAAGRERFDSFLRAYMEQFRFTSITTEEFLAYLDEHLPGLSNEVRAQDWLYSPGLPGNCPAFRAPKMEAVQAVAAGWAEGRRPTSEEEAGWDRLDLLLYLQGLPREMSREECAWLDGHFGLTPQGNYEVLVEWLTIALGSDYEPVFARVREVLGSVGRMKYIRPLYLALGRHQRTRALAREIYASARESYHGLTRRAAESVMAEYR